MQTRKYAEKNIYFFTRLFQAELKSQEDRFKNAKSKSKREVKKQASQKSADN